MKFRHLPSVVAAVLVASLLYFLFHGRFERFNRYDRLEDSLRNWKPDPARLIGTWCIAEQRGHAYLSDKMQTWRYEFPVAKSGNYYWTWTFTADGTCVDTPYKDEQVGKRHRYDWSLEGNRLILKDSDSEFVNGAVIELNDTLFVFFEDYDDGESWVHLSPYEPYKIKSIYTNKPPCDFEPQGGLFCRSKDYFCFVSGMSPNG